MRAFSAVASDAAARDLEMAVSYLADTLKSPAAARSLLDEYDRMLAILEEAPPSHPLVHDDLLAFAGYRWAGFGSYIAFYTVDERARIASIHRIAHKSRNWMRLLL